MYYSNEGMTTTTVLEGFLNEIRERSPEDAGKIKQTVAVRNDETYEYMVYCDNEREYQTSSDELLFDIAVSGIGLCVDKYLESVHRKQPYHPDLDPFIDRIMIKLINAERFLKKYPGAHLIQTKDTEFALCLFYNNDNDDRYILDCHDMLILGRNEHQELIHRILENSVKIMNPQVNTIKANRSMLPFLAKMQPYMFTDTEYKDLAGSSMICLIEDLSRRLMSPLYVMPITTDVIFAFAGTTSPARATEIHREFYENFDMDAYPETERLSDQLYYYDTKKGLRLMEK